MGVCPLKLVFWMYSFLRKRKSTTSVFLSRTQKNEPYLRCFCLVTSDQVELRDVVNIPTLTFGDQHIFFYKLSPLKNLLTVQKPGRTTDPRSMVGW